MRQEIGGYPRYRFAAAGLKTVLPGQGDREVTRITLDAALRLRRALTLAFKREIDQEELAPDADVDSMADFFEMTLAGIRMAAKGGKSRRALRNIAVFAGTAYLKSESTLAAKYY